MINFSAADIWTVFPLVRLLELDNNNDKFKLRNLESLKTIVTTQSLLHDALIEASNDRT